MRLSSARELKAQMQRDAAREFGDSVSSPQVLAAGPASWYRREVPAPQLRPELAPAFGLRRFGNKPTDFGVAVRIPTQPKRPARGPRYMARAERYSAEVEVLSVDYQARIAVQPGGSCGHPNITAGTLGGFVEDDDAYYILSNNHVLADSDDAAVGDPIWQPGRADLAGAKPKTIGSLSRWEPLNTGRCDAALAEVGGDATTFYPWWYQGIGESPSTAVGDRYSGTTVVKRGRTTGITSGEVSVFDLDGVTINYGSWFRPYYVTFDNQIEFVGTPATTAFSQPGDSGSFILDSTTLQPYALLYAGGPDELGIDRTIGTFMTDVLGYLGVRLVQP